MATLDTSIPFRAFGQQNLLESYYQGKAMKRQDTLGGMEVKGKQNVMLAESGRKIAATVLNSDNPERDYPRGLKMAQSMGIDVSQFPPEWGDDAQMFLKMISMPPEEQRAAGVWRQKMDEMIKGGMPPELARGIATGAYRKSTHPITGAVTVTDMGTGRPVDYGQQPSAPQAPPAAQVPAGDTLYGQAGEATGVVPSLKAAATDTLGQLPGALGRLFQFRETVEARQDFRVATNDLVRALSINPRFPVAEMNRIREEISITPEVWKSEEGLEARMLSVDRYLRGRVVTERQAAGDEKLPADQRQAAIQAARSIERFIAIMGVPQGDDMPGGGSDFPADILELMKLYGETPE